MIKTTDGVCAKPGKYYYSEYGEEVILEEAVVNGEGKTRYLVTPFYEGDSMTVSGAGGEHHEINGRYEHEGEQRLLDSIFCTAPTEKIDKKVKDIIDKHSMLVLAYGEILKQKKDEQYKLKDLKRIVKQFTIDNKEAFKKKEALADALDNLQEQVDKKRQELSLLEGNVGGIGRVDPLSGKEIAFLIKRSFFLDCLKAGGVDNWSFYDDSLADYHKRYPEG